MRWATNELKKKEENIDQKLFDEFKILIKDCLENINRRDKEEIKVGELIKMLELYSKMSPRNGEHKEFWDMLDKIRQESLGNNKYAKPQNNESRKSKKVVEK